jgi:hypothetical protein
MKTRLLSIAIAVIALVGTPFVRAQTPTPTPQTYLQALAAFNTTFPRGTPASPAIVAGLQALLAMPDFPTATDNGRTLSSLANAMCYSGTAPAVYIPVYFQAYQAGHLGSFVDYLRASIAAGGTYKSTAVGGVAAFVQANPNTYQSALAQAVLAESQNQITVAISAYQTAANYFTTWDTQREAAMFKVGQLSIKRGDSAAATEALLAPMLTAFPNYAADNSYQNVFKLVNLPNLPLATQKTFLVQMQTAVMATQANSNLLGLIKGQYDVLSGITATPTPTPSS